jgi:hypothetical protein
MNVSVGNCHSMAAPVYRQTHLVADEPEVRLAAAPTGGQSVTTNKSTVPARFISRYRSVKHNSVQCVAKTFC